MRTCVKAAFLVAAAGLVVPAVAQDSVSNSSVGGLPGDASSPWAAQCANYVVDLSPVQSSWGNTFGFAPLIKTSKTEATFFNSLPSASSISPDLLIGVPAASAGYLGWQTPGQGVNGEFNDPAQTFPAPTGATNQFAAGLAEFGTSTGGFNYNGIIGAVVNYTSNEPNRLWVTRKQLAVNAASDIRGDVSQLGGLSNDANGNFYIRADRGSGNNPIAGDPGLTSIVSGSSLFRIRLLDRACGSLNIISGNPATFDATNNLQSGGPTTSVPNNIPASVVGGNGLIAAANFNRQYAFGAASPLTLTQSHLAPGLGGDHRGSNGYTGRNLLGTGVATQGVLAKDAASDTTVLNVWSVSNTGAVVSTRGLQVPATSVTDNNDGFSFDTGAGPAEFQAYLGGQPPFRGPVGMVALGGDTSGNALVAGTMAKATALLADDFDNAIVVARFAPGTTTAVSWTLAAYIDPLAASPGFGAGGGKAITDGAGTTIGQLSPLFNVTGGAPLGPSISNPAIDAGGNIWFLASVELFNRLPGGGSDFDGALIRGVYDEASFSYELELVAELGTQIQGLNSGIPYSISFLATADSDGPASNSIGSANISGATWNGTAVGDLEPGDTRALGGMVFTTEIVYDADMDGDFQDPTSGLGGDGDGNEDEAYQVLMYVSHYADQTNPCAAIDLNGDGIVDFGDVGAFVNAFAGGNLLADVNGDGLLDFGDVGLFVNLFSQCL